VRKVPYFFQKLFGSITWRLPGVDPVLFLTFDDGPNPEVTPVVLDMLKSYNAHATFFCVGENIHRYPDIYRNIISGEHATGNHTFHHLNGWKTKTEAYIDDVECCSQAMFESTEIPHSEIKKQNIPNLLFRPPYGKLSLRQFRNLKSKYKIVMWDVISNDFDKSNSGEQCAANVCETAVNGSIVVFHDSLKAKDRMLYSLPKVLEHFSKRNFVFKSITPEIINSPD
jgi:peptidoglycan/xylan/chitin deacetylase (PgdA/CDA1 family)